MRRIYSIPVFFAKRLLSDADSNINEKYHLVIGLILI